MPARLWLFVVTIFTLTCGESTVLAEAPKKYALLIAVTKYRDGAMNSPKLVYPEQDARAMGSFLELYGYRCEYLLGEEATKHNIEQKLQQMSGKSNNDGVVVLGLWGHGVEFDGGEAMFCPYDTQMREAVDKDGNTLFKDDGSRDALIEPNPNSLVGMSRFLSGLRICGAGNRLLVADCCRAKPNAARGRGAFGSKITAADLPPGTAAIFACTAEQRAFEHENWKHGALTSAMLEELQSIAGRDNARVTDIIGKVADSVAAMVSTITRGREQQTIQPIMNGLPSLRLTRDMLTNSLEMKLALIPSGEFMAGSSLSAEEVKQRYPGSEETAVPESPQFRVQVAKPFYMGCTEVTVDQFRQFVQATDYKTTAELSKDGGLGLDPATKKLKTGTSFNWQNTGLRQEPNQPVVNVTIQDAQAFCQWLSKKENRRYRLPTEEEWEYGCRAGSNEEFHFGADAALLTKYENVSHPSRAPDEEMPSAVGQFLPNSFQLFDMHGNVSEICTGFNDISLSLLANQAYTELESYLRRDNFQAMWTKLDTVFDYPTVQLRSGKRYDLGNDKGKVLVLLLWDFGCCNHHGCALNAYDAITEQCDPSKVSVLTMRLEGFDDSNKIDRLLDNVPVIQGKDLAEKLDVSGFPTALIVKPGGEILKVHSGGSYPDGGFEFDVTCATHLALGTLGDWLPTQNIDSWLKRYKENGRYSNIGEAVKESFSIRGGNWSSSAAGSRAAVRSSARGPHFLVGFRVVAEVE